MTNRIRQYVLWIPTIVILVLVVASGCDIGNLEEETGSLTIVLDGDLETRTLQPDLDMEIATYVITGTHTRTGATFGPIELTGGVTSTTINRILVGIWSISVKTYNDDPTPVLIGQGTASATVFAESTMASTISVEPLSGTGSFSFTIDFTSIADILTNPSIEASFVPEGTEPTELLTVDLNDTEDGAVIDLSALSAGYYEFNYVIKDGEVSYGGNHHIVRIISGEATTGSFVLPADMLGSAQLTVENNMNNPFAVTITSSEGYVMAKDSTRSFTVAPAETGSTIEWFLDGVKVAGAIGATVAVDSSTLFYGSHNLTATVRQTDGRLSSGTTQILVLDSGYATFTFTNKNDPTEVKNYRLESGPSDSPDFEVNYGELLRFNEPMCLEALQFPDEEITTWIDFYSSSYPIPQLAYELNQMYFINPGVDLPAQQSWIFIENDIEQVSLDTAIDATYFDFFDFVEFDQPFYHYYSDDTTIEEMQITFTEIGPLGGGYVRMTFEGEVVEETIDHQEGSVPTGKTFLVNGDIIALRAQLPPL